MEIERARLTKTLANIKEQSGEVKEAASILQELQVSPFMVIRISFIWNLPTENVMVAVKRHR